MVGQVTAEAIGWRRCWYGRVLHYYGSGSNYKTLCGKLLRGHGDDAMRTPWPRCGRCDNILRREGREAAKEGEGST